MILRTIIFIAILIYFIWDYKQNKKNYKLLVLPIIGLTYFGGTDIFDRLDDRIQLSIVIITVVLTIMLIWKYYQDFKLERFKHKKYMRSLRDKSRQAKDEQLLAEIELAKSTPRETPEETTKSEMTENKGIEEISSDDNNSEDEDLRPHGRIAELDIELTQDNIEE